MNKKFLAVICFLFLLFFVPRVCCVAETHWTPEQVPAQNLNEFLFYYQRFLQANPFPIEHKPKDDEEKLKNRINHQLLLVLYDKLSEVAAVLSRTDDLPRTAPENVKKDKTNHIRGTWNLYRNIPVNATDLWAESCFLKYQSLVHEAELKPEKMNLLHEFVTEIEQYEMLRALFQHLKRHACLRSLRLIRQPIKDFEEDSEQKLPDIFDAENKLISANELFADFLRQYPNDDNMKTVEIFLDTLNRFRSHFPDSRRLSESVKLFRDIFIDLQKRESDLVIKEYAEIYEGLLRRQELIGKPMPIWGVDLAGHRFEEESLSGKVVLLDFWATWCGPCLGEFPHLKKLYAKYRRHGFEIIGYNVDSDLNKLAVYLEQNPLPWMILSKEATKRAGLPLLSGYYGARLLPVVLLRDQSGNTILLDARGEKLDAMLEQIFGR
ncbi:MAG: TlpA family protein disulfide reductase [Planctomycetaceae bacterium]|nr:TlpA family protein disulfide reductase [Planctomycetaceae bacterium]